MTKEYSTTRNSKKQGNETGLFVSLVVPLYNEEESSTPLLEEIHKALSTYVYPWELILVDDGSTDNTVPRLKELRKKYGTHIRIIEFRRNFGQTAAMQAGIDMARGDIIVTMDGDLQNDPNDIPRMLDRFLNDKLDLLVGWRKDRQDNLLLRKVPSYLANRLIANMTGVVLHDYGCSLKIYRASVLKNVRLYGEMHRFIPAWIAIGTSPDRIKEQIVTHHPRNYGASKYGISRTFRVLLDLLSVYFFMRFNARPGHFFGMIGFIFGAIGSMILSYLLFLKLLGESIGSRPLLLIGVLFVVMSVQFLSTGIIGELISRIYYESKGNRTYILCDESDSELGIEEHWKVPE